MVLGLLIFTFGPRLASFCIDWFWFGSADLAQVFAKSFKAQVFWALVRATRGRVLSVSIENSAALQRDTPGRLDRIALAAPVLAAFAGSLFAGNWRTFLFQAVPTVTGPFSVASPSSSAADKGPAAVRGPGPRS